jgi:hybrid cluster-associated redox disulfide protein
MSDIDNTHPHITDDWLVRDVIERHPRTIVVFARHGLQCPGCYIAPFHTITDCAREHATALGPLLRDLNWTVAAESA